ncbi:hypothetical protein BEL07_22940 [Mycolicibacterium grossiae]|uniref:GmrSD restriction endonucleases C-terminal domain-containing protein n=1 Tax=Mycolicibacterium grossiae TaxID=1552759 RepID=A0A1E8PYQ0_9MYCO|nr:HNH endonuclease family protein [Mycolicibacterium grossiae]OFJ51425.1 hypothetical protein BEL07_22940 [Mycolicibacterium grossiae]
MKRKYLTLAATAAVGIAVWLHPDLIPSSATLPQSSARPVAGEVAALLQQVGVVDHIADVEGYDRGCRRGEGCVFGPAWNDPLDKTGCDARNRMLAAQLRDVRFKPNTHNCKVIDGFLDPDPYTGQRVALQDIELDHVYALAAAWDAGAWQWDPQKRQIFANDAAELLAVSGPANRQKSDKRIDEWLPSFQPCAYVQRYLTVAVKYQLPITVAERNTAVTTCPAPA